MEELKPVAWAWGYRGAQVTIDKSLAMSIKADGVAVTPLYAIPEGYALVPIDAIPDQIRAACQTELGGYATSNLAGAFDIIGQMYTSMINAYQSSHKDAAFPRGSVVDEEV